MVTAIYDAPGTLLTFQDSSGDAVITLNNLGVGAGQYSARYDRGAGSLPMWFRLWGILQFDTAPVVGEAVEIYVVPWSQSGTYAAGGLGTSDAALTTELRRNLNNGIPALLVTVDKTSTATNIISSTLLWVPSRYITVAVWNATADALQASANVSKILLEPYFPELQ